MNFPQTHLHVMKQPSLVAANPFSICMNQNARNFTTEMYMRSKSLYNRWNPRTWKVQEHLWQVIVPGLCHRRSSGIGRVVLVVAEAARLGLRERVLAPAPRHHA